MKTVKRLSALGISRLKADGLYHDGDGLYLRIKGGSRVWVFRYQLGGKRHWMGFGSADVVSLEAARRRKQDARAELERGLDPIEGKRIRESEAAARAERQLTFDECADRFINAHEEGWSNPKSPTAWRNTLATYCGPIFGSKAADEVDTEAVMQVLEPLWKTKTETASRLRGRIERVLDWAKVRGYRSGENPARWRGHLDALLPQRSKVAPVKHHPALPWKELPAFMDQLRQRPGVAPLALAFAILTACRVSEAVNATWQEFDLDGAIWQVPAERMKARRVHRVPLSPPALEILRSLQKTTSGEFVFPGWSQTKPLSIAGPLRVLHDMDRHDLTVHGFRSTFRVWVAETTDFPRELAEASLAHVITDATVAAYLRSDVLERRRTLMNTWGSFAMGFSRTSMDLSSA